MAARVLLVLLVLVLFAAGRALYRRRQVNLQRGPDVHPLVPESLREGAERTWVLFTTPWCAVCGPAEERLRAANPDVPVVRVDATREPELARTFQVRSVPTAVLAGEDGEVQARLVGLPAVDRYLGSDRSGHPGWAP